MAINDYGIPMAGHGNAMVDRAMVDRAIAMVARGMTVVARGMTMEDHGGAHGRSWYC